MPFLHTNFSKSIATSYISLHTNLSKSIATSYIHLLLLSGLQFYIGGPCTGAEVVVPTPLVLVKESLLLGLFGRNLWDNSHNMSCMVLVHFDRMKESASGVFMCSSCC